jgi:hypothetical protein
MRGAVMYGPGDVRVDEREEPRIVEPTDAIIRVSWRSPARRPANAGRSDPRHRGAHARRAAMSRAQSAVAGA